MTVFLVCAGILGLLTAALAINIGRLRRLKRVSLGDGGDKDLTAAIRAHGNLVEWVPLCLLLIYLLHGPYGNRNIAILAVLLTVGRLAHVGGMLGFVPMGRTAGAILTMLVTLVASVMLILAGLRTL